MHARPTCPCTGSDTGSCRRWSVAFRKPVLAGGRSGRIRASKPRGQPAVSRNQRRNPGDAVGIERPAEARVGQLGHEMLRHRWASQPAISDGNARDTDKGVVHLRDNLPAQPDGCRAVHAARYVPSVRFRRPR
jgi:hypothetical protein